MVKDTSEKCSPAQPVESDCSGAARDAGITISLSGSELTLVLEAVEYSASVAGTPKGRSNLRSLLDKLRSQEGGSKALAAKDAGLSDVSGSVAEEITNRIHSELKLGFSDWPVIHFLVSDVLKTHVLARSGDAIDEAISRISDEVDESDRVRLEAVETGDTLEQKYCEGRRYGFWSGLKELQELKAKSKAVADKTPSERRDT